MTSSVIYCLLINYELIETLVSHVVSSQQVTSSQANAILIFLPGVPEISRLVRAQQVCKALCKALWPQCAVHMQK